MTKSVQINNKKQAVCDLSILQEIKRYTEKSSKLLSKFRQIANIKVR